MLRLCYQGGHAVHKADFLEPADNITYACPFINAQYAPC